jgi:hypothetical protein
MYEQAVHVQSLAPSTPIEPQQLQLESRRQGRGEAMPHAKCIPTLMLTVHVPVQIGWIVR